MIPRVQNITKTQKQACLRYGKRVWISQMPMKMAVWDTEAVKNISNLKNTPNFQERTFGMQSEAKMHPKSRIRAIWDTFVLLKTPQIFIKAHLGYICPLKTTPNQEYEPFGMHLPPQNHPKSQKTDHLGCKQSKNASQTLFNFQFGIHLPSQKHPKSRK